MLLPRTQISMILGAALFFTSGICRAQSTLEGDLYLRTASGDVRQGAGVTVRLLADSEALRAAISGACDTIPATREFWWKRENARGATPSAALQALRERSVNLSVTATVLQRVVHVIDSAPALTAEAGMRARFAFGNLAPGRYALAATWRIAGKMFSLFRWVEVTESTVADLNHDYEFYQRGLDDIDPAPACALGVL